MRAARRASHGARSALLERVLSDNHMHPSAADASSSAGVIEVEVKQLSAALVQGCFRRRHGVFLALAKNVWRRQLLNMTNRDLGTECMSRMMACWLAGMHDPLQLCIALQHQFKHNLVLLRHTSSPALHGSMFCSCGSIRPACGPLLCCVFRCSFLCCVFRCWALLCGKSALVMMVSCCSAPCDCLLPVPPARAMKVFLVQCSM